MRNEVNLKSIGQPIFNMVIVEVIDTFNEFNSKGGIIIPNEVAKDSWSDSEAYKISEHVIRHGTVVKVPKHITSEDFDYETTCEIEIGDEVFWNIGDFKDFQPVVVEDKKYLVLDYHSIHMRIRDGKKAMINGFCLLRPIQKTKKAMEFSITEKVTEDWELVLLPESRIESKIKKRNSTVNWDIGSTVRIMVGINPFKISGDINIILEEQLYCCYEWMILLQFD